MGKKHCFLGVLASLFILFFAGNVHASTSETLCERGTYLSGTECLECPQNASCPGGDASFTCNDGYAQSGNTCIKEGSTPIKITFNKNGGTGSLGNSTGINEYTHSCISGELCRFPDTNNLTYPEDGYFLAGWSTDIKCENVEYTDSGTFYKNTTLYACWQSTAVQCLAGYYYDGQTQQPCESGWYCPGIPGENNDCRVQCPDAGEHIIYSDPLAELIFDCYIISDPYDKFEHGTASANCYIETNTEKNYGNCIIQKIYDCDPGYEPDEKDTNDKKCVASTFNAIYDCGDGQGEKQTNTGTYDSEYTILDNFCTYPGYNFTSWFDGEKYRDPNISITWKYLNDVKFTAQWEICELNTTATGTCGCEKTQYPNGIDGCSDCETSCAENPKFNLGSYNVCNKETALDNCYRLCTIDDVPNALEVEGQVSQSGSQNCYPVLCNPDYYVHDIKCQKCPENAICNGELGFSCKEGYELSEDELSCVPKTYKITLNKNGGTGGILGSTGTNNATTSCQHGKSCTLPSTGLTKEGFEFTGWGENADCSSGGYTFTFTSEKTMYACWSQTTVQCLSGQYYNGTEFETCPTSGMYCTGTGFANVGTPGCSTTCPEGFAGSEYGSTEITKCYVLCPDPEEFHGGQAQAYKPREYYDTETGKYPACRIEINCDYGYYGTGNQTPDARCNDCPPGYVCNGGYGNTEPEPCPEGQVCTQFEQFSCPEGGTSDVGASDISECYKVCPESVDIENGTAISTGNKNYDKDSEKYPDCEYTVTCDENYKPKAVVSSDPGCVWANPDDCPANHFCPPEADEPIPCPQGGQSEPGSTSPEQCYMIFRPYRNFEHGEASAKCYLSNESKYDSNCTIVDVHTCDAGYWYNERENEWACSPVDSAYYSPEDALVQTPCPTDPTFTIGSDPLAYAVTQCYKNCTLIVPNASNVIPDQTKAYALDDSGYNKCAFTVNCNPGYVPNGNGSENPSCTEETYTVILNKNGGSGSSVPESITCNFGDGKTCILPETAGLTRTGYAVGSDWCSDEKGGTPCYTGGTGITLAAFGKETIITLYATWDAEVYSIKLNNDDADTPSVPNTIYLKYETGWYSDSGAQTVLNKLTTLPTKTGYTFAGYYSTDKGEVQIINNDGALQTSEDALTFTSTNTSINPRWATGVVTCAAGTYYPGTGSSCLPCTENNYCPGGEFATDSGHPDGINACPNQGLSPEKSTSASMCYKTNLVYNATHGDGTQTCYYEESSRDYSSNCKDKVITACDAGYYYNSSSNTTDCVEVGIGYYSPASIITKSQCPQSGTTATSTSAAVTECFKNNLPCTITSGTGTNTCYYSETSSSYTSNCSTCLVAACDPGYYLVDGECVKCPAGNVCNAEGKKTCASLTGGIYPESDAGISDVAMCYKNCTLPANAASVTGRDYYTASDTCEIIKCKAGYTLDNGACVKCPAGSFCDGSTTPVIPGEDAKSCTKLGDGSWNMSAAGATNENDCYKVCEEYDVVGGIGIPLNDTVFYPNSCQFKYVSDSGEPCELIDGICVVTSCKPGYEKIGEDCVPCNVEFAKTYKSTGVCQVDSCVIGYHPRGRACEEDIKECSLPNVEYATQSWDYKLNAFGPCTVKECGEGYHVASNACVSDVQPCSIENGIGYKEWDHYSKTWGKCIATSCAPGYTNDPSETDEPIKPCGECRNRYSVLGQLAVSSYVKGCEIASCMYQGELYNLENNECVPICPQEEYEDETGTMVWDQSRKKCVRTCKEGYTMW